MPRAKLSIPVPDELAQLLPDEPQEQQQVLVWGLREWRVN